MSEYIVQIAGWIVQLVGIIIVLGNQASFYLKTKKNNGSVVKAFYEISAMRWGMNDKELEKASDEKIKETFPLTKWLYSNYRNSIIGAILTLVGVIISSIGLFV